jgi:hypothetical protein
MKKLAALIGVLFVIHIGLLFVHPRSAATAPAADALRIGVVFDVGGRGDEELVTFSIRTARSEAWHEATRLAGESPEQRERSRLSLDRRVTLLASRIIMPDGPLGLASSLIARTESTDLAAVTAAMLAIV